MLLVKFLASCWRVCYQRGLTRLVYQLVTITLNRVALLETTFFILNPFPLHNFHSQNKVTVKMCPEVRQLDSWKFLHHQTFFFLFCVCLAKCTIGTCKEKSYNLFTKTNRIYTETIINSPAFIMLQTGSKRTLEIACMISVSNSNYCCKYSCNFL